MPIASTGALVVVLKRWATRPTLQTATPESTLYVQDSEIHNRTKHDCRKEQKNGSKPIPGFMRSPGNHDPETCDPSCNQSSSEQKQTVELHIGDTTSGREEPVVLAPRYAVETTHKCAEFWDQL